MSLVSRIKPKHLVLFSLLIGAVLLNACAVQIKKTAPDADQVPVYIPPPIKPTEKVRTATPEGGSEPTKIVCEDKLTFIEDVNFPDGTLVKPQQTIEKQWKVMNSGLCDWNNQYTIKFKEGDTMGADEVQPLYPARSESEFVIKVIFIAPVQPGYYRGVWQASNPDGMLFGDPFYIDIIVGN